MSVLRQFTTSDYFFGIFCYCISVLRLFTASDYSFGIFWSLYCLYFVYLQLLITPLVYFGHCIVITSSIYGFWLLLWYILYIVSSVLRQFSTSDYFFGIFWSLYCLYFVYLRLLITPLVYYGHCIVRTSSIYASDYSFGIFCHCIVCTSSIYCLWLLLCYILVIVLCVRRLFTAYDYFFGIFWSLHCLYFVYLRLLITPLVYFGHCIVRASAIYGFWLLLWYILVIVWS